MQRFVAVVRANSWRVSRLRVVAVPTRSWFGFSVPPDPKETEPPVLLFLKTPPNDKHLFEKPMTAEEKLARDTLNQKIHALADQEPVQEAPEALVREVIEVSMKFNDWRGVVAAQRVAADQQYAFDDSFNSAVQTYLVKAKQEDFHSEGW